MSMIDLEQPRVGDLLDHYQNQFVQHASSLPDDLVRRVRASAGVVLRTRTSCRLGTAIVPLVVETVLEQRWPCVWRVQSQRVAPSGDVRVHELALWSSKSADAVPGGTGSAALTRHLVRELHDGEEGVHWRLLDAQCAVA
ncbi:MAG: hypothetical protein MK074_05570 [Phycisphaerales bacterium]|nr:hypothetical protein [Phycisphaerales bacterium]